MDPKEIRKKEMKEMIEMREKLEGEISDEYFAVRTGKENNVRKPRRMRKDLAVLNTIIAEKERANLKKTGKNG